MVTGGKASSAVRTTAYRNRLTHASSKSDRSRDIFGGGSSYDQGRPFVDRVIPYLAGRLVVRLAWADDRTGQGDFQFAYRRLAEYAGGDARSAIGGHAAKLRKPT